MADDYLWLENIDGNEALTWVRKQNAAAAQTLANRDSFARIKEDIRGALDSDEKIPAVSKVGDYYYNFWRDSTHVRGIWRRTTPASYATDNPEWETVLDIDALAQTEEENWVWHGALLLREDLPDGNRTYRRALVSLSRGGADANVTREFDLETKQWVEGGFYRPESKGGMSWIDQDTVFVFTDTGEGSMTSSGYPRQVRRWRRGTPLEEAPVVYEGVEEDMYILAQHDSTPGFERDFVIRVRAFYDTELYLLTPGVEGQEPLLIDVPRSAETGLHREWLLVELREDWQVGPTSQGGERTTYTAGSLLAILWEDFQAGSRDFHVLFAPTASTSLAGAGWTRNFLILNVLEDVKTRLYVLTPGRDGFSSTPFPNLPEVGTVGVGAVESRFSDDVWVTTTDFLTPTTFSLASITSESGVNEGSVVVEREELKSAPAFFDATGLVATQRFATSADGTRVPYFLIHREGVELDGTTPTLLYGYGGFEISLTPSYSAGLGIGWLERGGAYALANIRGGGEYGPAWHQAALKENRHKAYEDFAAVAQNLVDTGVTSPARLGIQGGSNGGLLTGNMLVNYPELFGAVVIQVPLLDMKRYSHLLAGASWMAEYGDPDSDDWEFIQSFSPYHLFDPAQDYPPVLITTSTRDDRVHPGHARKMAAKMLAAGKDVTYYENIEGGHGGAANNEQAAHMAALAYEFLATRLGLVD